MWKEVLDMAALGKFSRQPLDWNSTFSFLLKNYRAHWAAYHMLLPFGEWRGWMCAEEPIMWEPFLDMHSPSGWEVKKIWLMILWVEGTCPRPSQIPSYLSCTDWLLQWHLLTFLEAVAGESMSVGVMGPFTLGYILHLASLQERERKWAFMEYILCLKYGVRSFTYATKFCWASTESYALKYWP